MLVRVAPAGAMRLISGPYQVVEDVVLVPGHPAQAVALLQAVASRAVGEVGAVAQGRGHRGEPVRLVVGIAVGAAVGVRLLLHLSIGVYLVEGDSTQGIMDIAGLQVVFVIEGHLAFQAIVLFWLTQAISIIHIADSFLNLTACFSSKV